MLHRWGMGPVFAFESRLASRRWQVYAGRSAFVLMLLAGMVIVWMANVSDALLPGGRAPTIREMAAVGKWFFYSLTGIQVSLILLAAPASAAGAFGMDRARGKLLHMMVTDLSDAEIVLGTLAARLTPVFGLIACAVPVTALAALLGGIEFGALAGAFFVSLALAVLGCVLALVLSIRVTKMHEVLMAVYVAEALWLLALPIWWDLAGAPPAWFQKANPYVLVFAPYYNPGFAGVADFAAFVGGALTLSAALLGLAIVRLRRVVLDQGSRPSKAARRRRLPDLKTVFPSWPSPTLDGNPVLWREWHRNRPSRLARRLWTLLLVLTWAQAAWGTYRIITEGVDGFGKPALESGLMFQLMFGMLMLSATAPTALAEERASGSLGLLLATPLSTGSIVLAKWWGVFRRVLVLLPLPLFAAVFLAAASPDRPVIPAGSRLARPPAPLTLWDRLFTAILCPADFLASGAVIVSVGLILAVWVRRMGRAVALSVIFYFLSGIVWCILVEISYAFIIWYLPNPVDTWFQENHWLSECMVALSPIFGTGTALNNRIVWYAWPERAWRWIGLVVVVGIKWAVAGLLLWLSVLTFDRRMGRVPESRPPTRDEEPVILEALEPSAPSLVG